ncbi:MAG: ABC transporter, partial [Actinobacteria bacterium HGW-Actinobacteria-8]
MRAGVRSSDHDRGVTVRTVDVSKIYRLGQVEVPALKSVSVEILAGEMI